MAPKDGGSGGSPGRAVKAVMMVLVCLGAGLGLGGCWDYVDLDRRGIILGLELSGEGDGIQVLAEMAAPSALAGGGKGGGQSSSGGQEQRILLSDKGKGLADTIRRLRTQTDRRIFWGFISVIVVEEGLARRGLEEVVESMVRDARIRTAVLMFAAPDASERILEQGTTYNPLTSLYLRLASGNFLDAAQMRPATTLAMFMRDTLGEGAALLPAVRMAPTGFNTEGAAVFRGYNMVGWLDAEETEGANWFRGEAYRPVWTVDCPDGDGEFSFQVMAYKVRVRHVMGPAGPRPTVTVRGRGAVRHLSFSCQPSIRHSPHLYEDVLADQVENMMQRAHDAARRLDTDFIKLGGALFRHHRRWYEEYGTENLLGEPIEYDIKITIGDPGDARSPRDHGGK